MSDAPKSGAEIMDVMETNLQGWCRPSPGSVYPMLKAIVDEGVLIRSDNRYSLTPKGREEIDHPFLWPGRPGSSPRSVEAVLDEISNYVSYLEDLSQASDNRVGPNAERIRELSARLAKIGESK